MRTHAGQRGQIIPLIAVALAVLMGFAGVGVDVSYLEYRQQTQQSATDAAAAGGAGALKRAGCPNASAANAAAYLNASNNGYPNGGTITVTPNNPPLSGPFANNGCAVSVTITTQGVSTFFSRIFGYQSGMNETTHAVAIVSSSGAGCIYLLSPTVSQNLKGATLNASQCGILINDTANFSGASVSASSIGYAGGAPNEGGATFSEAAPAPMLPVADPCPEIAGCAYLAANPPSTSGCTSLTEHGYTGTIGPGCYNSINLSSSTVTLSPGIYVINGGTNFNSSTITGDGVTLYVTANGTPPNFNGDVVSLSPPTSGNEDGVVYYQVPSNTNSPNFNGTNVSYSGLIYCPGGTSVNFNGANGTYLVLVFGAANFNSGSAYDFATPQPGQSLIKQAVVAE